MREVIWMAPASGKHDFSLSHMQDYDIDYCHWVLIPSGTTVTGLLWQESVCSRGAPNTMGMVGRNIILQEPYGYGMAVRL